MADNTTINAGSGGDTIATDDVTTLNGGASSAVKVQRVKIGFGDDGTHRDASAAFPLPVNQDAVTATGSIAALNASVALTLAGAAGAVIDVRGTWVATLTFQATIDGTTWFTVNVVPAGSTPANAAVTTTTTSGAWIVPCAGFAQVRATATAFTSGSATVILRAVQSPLMIYNLPTGATTQAVSGNLTTVSTVTTVSAVTAANLHFPQTIADVASAALTTTTTTAAFTPTFGCSYQVNIPVTVVSGTNPTLDVVVQESDDGGTNWYDTYHFPRITATGMYRSPVMTLTGNRVRYVQTVSGTTPSFTRAINRLQASVAAPIVRGLIDRAIAPNTLNSASSALNTDGCTTFNLTVVSGAGASVAPVYGIQVSDDNANWADTGVSLSVAASVTVMAAVSGIAGRFARVYIKTAGTGATQTYAVLRAIG